MFLLVHLIFESFQAPLPKHSYSGIDSTCGLRLSKVFPGFEFPGDNQAVNVQQVRFEKTSNITGFRKRPRDMLVAAACDGR